MNSSPVKLVLTRAKASLCMSVSKCVQKHNSGLASMQVYTKMSRYLWVGGNKVPETKTHTHHHPGRQFLSRYFLF